MGAGGIGGYGRDSTRGETGPARTGETFSEKEGEDHPAKRIEGRAVRPAPVPPP